MSNLRFIVDMSAPSAQKTFDEVTARLGKLDESLKRTRMLDISDKSAAASLIRTQLRADKLRESLSMDMTIRGQAAAEAKLLTLEATAGKLDDKLSASAGSAEKATGAFGGLGGPSGIGAAIGAAAALSPVLITLGTGLGGLALAAAGTAKGIETAAKKTGGLQANLGKLDPEQRRVATSLLSLQHQYQGFEKALEPTVLGVFNQGLKIAGHLLHDIEPVTQATGKAFGTWLGQVDTMFQGGTWQQFFGFMARTAQPDMQLLGTTLIDTAKDIPPLVESLQPLATALLRVTDDAAKAIGGLEHFNTAATNAITKTEKKAGPPGSFFGGFVNDVRKFITLNWSSGASGTDKAARAVQGLGAKAGPAAVQIDKAANATRQLAAAQRKLDAATAYANSLVTTANDAKSLSAALKTSHDRIGLHTAAQRASFGAANTFISDLETQAQKAIASGHGVDAATSAIRRHLPELQDAKSGTKAYWQEVQTLIRWLEKLRAEHAIHQNVVVHGTGKWVAPGGMAARPGFASGTAGAPPGWAWIGERGPELVNMKGGETVLSHPHSVKVTRGFAGGIIGSYDGPVKGLQPWAASDWQATISDVISGIASSMARSFKSAFGQQVANTGSGTARWTSLVRHALLMENLSPFLISNVLRQMSTESGGNPNAINLTDSNAAAGDPSRGLMQTIMSTFRAYHWPGTSWNIYDPLANIAAALNYGRHVYGPTLMRGGMGIGSGHGYAMGSWNVPYTGPATVHQGEIIVPARQAAAIRSAGAQPQKIVLEVRAGDHSGATRFIVDAIQNYVTVHGGDAQTALGQRS